MFFLHQGSERSLHISPEVRLCDLALRGPALARLHHPARQVHGQGPPAEAAQGHGVGAARNTIKKEWLLLLAPVLVEAKAKIYMTLSSDLCNETQVMAASTDSSLKYTGRKNKMYR